MNICVKMRWHDRYKIQTGNKYFLKNIQQKIYAKQHQLQKLCLFFYYRTPCKLLSYM